MLIKGLKPKVEIIDEVSNIECEYWEKFWIELFSNWGFNLVNGAIGGFGFTKGHLVSEETKEKNRLSALGNLNRRGKKCSIENE